MKKLLLAAAALIAVSTAAHADALPKEMLGDWCELSERAARGQIFERGSCADAAYLLVKPNGFNGATGTEGYGCDFKKITRLTNSSYFVHAECGGEGGLANEDYVLQVEDKQLKMISVTVRFCVSVIEPPPEVVKDPEFDPKSWLGLREKPNMKSRITFRLGDKEYLEADRVKGDWTHISNVDRLSEEIDNVYSPKIVQGWVRSKYVQKFNCDDKYQDPTSGDIKPEDIVRPNPVQIIPVRPVPPTELPPAFQRLQPYNPPPQRETATERMRRLAR
jgi:hypothetical protein